MRCVRDLTLRLHFRPDLRPDGPELSGRVRLSAPMRLTDETVNRAVAEAMRLYQKECPDGLPLPTFEDFALNLFAAANRLYQVTWDIEIIEPDAVTTAVQHVDALGGKKEITVSTVSGG